MEWTLQPLGHGSPALAVCTQVVSRRPRPTRKENLRTSYAFKKSLPCVRLRQTTRVGNPSTPLPTATAVGQGGRPPALGWFFPVAAFAISVAAASSCCFSVVLLRALVLSEAASPSLAR